MKVSTKRLKALIQDEKMAAKKYRRYGYPNLARDESKHKLFLTKILRSRQ